MLPNVAPIVGAQSALNFGYVLAELAACPSWAWACSHRLSDWGAMINEAQAGLVGGHFLPAIVPAIAVVIVVVAVNIIGEELSDRIGGKTARMNLLDIDGLTLDLANGVRLLDGISISVAERGNSWPGG